MPPEAGLFFCAAVVDVIEQLLHAQISADLRLFILAEFDRAQSGKILRIFRNLDQLLGLHALRNFDLALLPHARNIRLPRLTHSLDEAVGAAQQQYMRAQGMPARQHAQILQHDGFEERSHQFMGGRAGLLQTVDVGFRKHAALAGNLVQLDAVVGLVGQLGRGNLQLGVDLVDDCARTAGALVVHGGDLLLAPGLFIIFEDDDLGVLPAQLDDRVHLGMKLLDGERNGVHFLHELGADHLRDGAAARPVMKMRVFCGLIPVSASMRRRNSRHLFRLPGFVALIVLPDGLIGRGVHHDRFDRGGAHIQTNKKLLHSLSLESRFDNG